MIYKSTIELIGKTPLVELSRIETSENLPARILAKVEYFNPGGSIKDRTALSMIEDAEAKGLLKPGGTIIEPTSGNTGVGLAWISRVKGYNIILTMPESMSLERRNLLKAYGAKLVLTPAAEGMKGAIAKAKQLCDEIGGSIIMGQFDNPANPAIHERCTAEEIWTDTDGKVDIVVGGVGTGGTISGISKRLRAYNKDIRTIAVEPETSAVISGGKAGAHKIQGIGAGFIPANYNPEVISEVLPVSNEDAIGGARRLAHEEGLLVGISSGAAFHAALQIAKKSENKGKTIVVILPDTGERYLSTGIFE